MATSCERPVRSDAGGWPQTMRLQRFLARAGVASRRGSEGLMTAGRVTVNGRVATGMGTKVEPDRDIVAVDGREVRLGDAHGYVMLYKPAGYVSTMSDPRGRACVADLVPRDRFPGLFPVGRLDRDTTGLLLFTTNGVAGNALLHPSREVEKHYVAVVRGTPDERALERLRSGVMTEGGRARPARVERLGVNDEVTRPVTEEGVPTGCSVVGLWIHEGKKHQVKNMLEAVGHPVVRLHRDRFGPLALTGLAPGRWRPLDAGERAAVERVAAGGGADVASRPHDAQGEEVTEGCI